jgi:hypothetical protein
VTLLQNPVFLTERRLVHRAGVLAAVLIAALIGLSLVAGLLYSSTARNTFPSFTFREVGKVFYGWLIGMQMLVLIVGGFSRIARVLADDRKAGLWDSNRLTPMKPSELVVGYWLGAGLREFYMSAVLAALGLVLVGLAGLPFTLWLGTQVLLAGAALFFGLIAVATGMTSERSQSGMLVLLIIIFAQLLSFYQSRFLLTNFLLPIYPTIQLFGADSDWSQFPEFFGLSVPSVPYSLCLQFVIGLFLWRAVVRKAANPFQPLLRRREAVALFGVLVVAQHGLIWGLRRGQFGTGYWLPGHEPMLAIVHVGTLLVGALVLALASPMPERLRVEALRVGGANLRTVLSRSAAAPGIALAGIASAALCSHCLLSLPAAWRACLVAAGNLLAFFTVFSLWLEYCRLRFQRRALGFFALGLFILCLLPFVMAGVLSTPALCRLSLLSPGVIALARPETAEMNWLEFTTAGHLAIAATLFLLWRTRWQQSLKAIGFQRQA